MGILSASDEKSRIRIRIRKSAVGTDPRVRIRTKMSRNHNTARKYKIWIRQGPSRYLSPLLAGNAGLAEVNLLLADVAQGVLLRLHLLVDELGEAGPNILHQAWEKRDISSSVVWIVTEACIAVRPKLRISYSYYVPLRQEPNLPPTVTIYGIHIFLSIISGKGQN